MKRIFISLALVASMLGLVGYIAQPAYANGIDQARSGSNKVKTGGSNSSSVTSLLRVVTNTLLFVAGAVAVVMIVLGGLKYITSNGNADQIKSAKNTIMYAVIGLVVAIAAYAIVGFVIDQL